MIEDWLKEQDERILKVVTNHNYFDRDWVTLKTKVADHDGWCELVCQDKLVEDKDMWPWLLKELQTAISEHEPRQ